MTSRPRPEPSRAPTRALRRPGRGAGPLAAAACLLSLAAPAVAWEVSGAVSVPAEPAGAAPAEAPHYWEEWNGFLDPARRRFDAGRELTVVLTGEPRSAPLGCDYALVGGDLRPRTLVVRAGATFRIANRGATSHALHAPTLPELTPLQTAPGNARTVSVPRAGRWEVRDSVFPHVRGTLVAREDLVACAAVAADGSYRFPDLPAGAYTLRVFRDGEAVVERDVEVTNRNLVVEALPLP